MSVSVYYPYYDVYADIDDPMEETRMLEDRRKAVVLDNEKKLFREYRKELRKTWLDIPNQDYLQPRKDCNRGSM